jgi:hypothetical protein
MKNRLSSLAAIGLLLTAMALTPGCGKKEDKLDVAAPPPSNPAAQPEVSPTKRRPNAPPTMGNQPQAK